MAPKLLQGCTLRLPAVAIGKFSSQQKAWGESQHSTSSLSDFPQLHHLHSGDNNGSVAVEGKEPNTWNVPGRWLAWMDAQQMAVFTLREVKRSSRPCSQTRASIFRDRSGSISLAVVLHKPGKGWALMRRVSSFSGVYLLQIPSSVQWSFPCLPQTHVSSGGVHRQARENAPLKTKGY